MRWSATKPSGHYSRRINIVEPDGTVRLTISNRADFPGAGAILRIIKRRRNHKLPAASVLKKKAEYISGQAC
jgi:hypothetical protein